MNAKLNAAQLFAGNLQSTLKKANDGLARFQRKFAADPLRTIGWSDTVYTHAAEVSLTKEVLDSLANGVSLADICADLDARVIAAASSTSMSTAQSSNLTERAKLAATARILREGLLYLAIETKAANPGA